MNLIPVKIAIVGAGRVGANLAYALLLRGLVAEIVLIDRDHGKAQDEAIDLQHAAPFSHPTQVRAGTLEDTAGAAVTVICAGLQRKPGIQYSELLRHNAAVIKEIIPEIVNANPEGIIVVASDPVDVLTYGAWRLAGRARGRVFGTGTLLDTARFRALLAMHFHIDPASVHAYILGEHGRSALPVWSSATIAGMSIRDICKLHGCDSAALNAIFQQVREAASALADGQGVNGYAMGAGLAQLLASIIRDEKHVFTVSSVLQGEYGVTNVALSVPTVVSSKGIEQVLKLELDDSEVAQFLRAGRTIHQSDLDANFVVTSRLKAS